MPKPLKVAYYLSRFPWLSQTFIFREMALLREKGVDVQIFSILPPPPATTMHQQVQELMPFAHYSPFLFSVRLIQAQFTFLFRSPNKFFRALWRVIWQTWPEPATCIKALALFPKSVYFAKQLEEMKVDHVHAHFVWLNGVSAQVAADLIGIPCSLHAHAWDIFQRNPECVRRQVELATCIVTVSEYHRQFLANLCPHRRPQDFRIVHYGLDPQEFTPAPVPSDGQTMQIISVGRLVEKKGFKYLIDACAWLADKGYSIRCLIVGEGPLRPALQAQIESLGLQDRVFLLGARRISDVLELYRQSNIFALECVVAKCGDRDGMPNVLLEAMAMQVPVITTPVTGNPELVVDEKTGLMVPERDAEALGRAIERLINDPLLRARLGEQGRQTVLAGFDIRQTAGQLAAIFQEINQ
jgi:colanic acid/amylovoran biosynthesis glycosyltransferase